ncbi:MAG: alkyl hydroperoxide reductase/Thiol specific antioxidant/Mal allergen [Schlesneria sp.]|nr:alkyl hydroperoxide reductase/Thiol specific antioxidant/Mal allergen [Schlesneria sp.]
MKTMKTIGWCLMTAVALSLGTARAADPVDLKVGDAAPTFHAKDDTGAAWKSADHIGKKIVVVYFYPADFTGGCTKQACGFRDDMAKLAGKDVEVVGVSGDSVETHQKFKKHHELNFALLADADGKVAEKFGVPVTVGEATAKVKVDDKDEAFVRTATIKRWTFVIDKNGKIASKDTEVKAADDSKAILQVIEKLK